MQPSVIQAGNFSLRTFQENGVHTHAAGIESFYRLGYNGVISANRDVKFQVDNPILLKTLWLLASNSFESGHEIFITLSSGLNNYQYTINVPVQQIAITNVVAAWQFPEFVLEPEVMLMFSANFEMSQFNFFAEPCNMHPLILGQMI